MLTTSTQPFTPDDALIRKARGLARSLKPKFADDRERILELLTDLTTAVQLAGGPLPDRCAVWKKKAGEFQSRLRTLVEQVEAAAK